MSLLSMCNEYALEDEVSTLEMNKYLITCINDDLAEAFYKPITVLPKKD